jgi:hypothetical protein
MLHLISGLFVLAYSFIFPTHPLSHVPNKRARRKLNCKRKVLGPVGDLSMDRRYFWAGSEIAALVILVGIRDYPWNIGHPLLVYTVMLLSCGFSFSRLEHAV